MELTTLTLTFNNIKAGLLIGEKFRSNQNFSHNFFSNVTDHNWKEIERNTIELNIYNWNATSRGSHAWAMNPACFHVGNEREQRPKHKYLIP